MTRDQLRRWTPLLGVALFSFALWLLHHQLRHFHYRDVLDYLHSLPADRVVLAIGLTVLGYFVLTGYDTLGVRQLGHALPFRKTALAAFTGYAFSNALGHPVFTSTPIRARLYSTWGLSAIDIAKVVAFCFLTFWLGFFSLGGVLFLFDPFELPAGLHMPVTSLAPLGLVLMLLVVGYLVASSLRRRPIQFRGLEIQLPSPGIAVAQILVSVLDWIVAASVLFVLLPLSTPVSFLTFLSGFLFAQVAGVLSLVPGGLGVFETVIVLIFTPQIPAPVLLGALLAYRGVYYLLPLVTATALFVTFEVLERKEQVARFARGVAELAPGLVPQILAFTTFLGGVVLLFSGATPAASSRLAWLNDLLPLPLIEASHLLGSIAGVGLLFLARGLQRRLDAAYHLATALLAGGIVVSLLKGLDYEEAIALAVMLLALRLSRREFFRRASLLTQWPSTGWLAAIAITLIATLWLGLFSFKNVAYSQQLWWRFTLFGDAPRFLRAMVAAVVAAVALAGARLLRPARPTPTLPSPGEIAKARLIIESSPRTYAHLALLGDKELLFSDDLTGFLMYGIEGRSWVSMGDPVGPAATVAELLWRFRELCDVYGGWTVFYQVRPENLHLYVDLGLSLTKIGEEGRVWLPGFDLRGAERKGLRNPHHRLGREGFTVTVLSPAAGAARLDELAAISDAWLAARQMHEKGFSLGFFARDYLSRLPIAVVEHEGRALAFANLWLGAQRHEASVDLMRYLPEAPPGVMDFLFVELILWARREGFHWFNLGMSPLAGLDEGHPVSAWRRLGALVYRHGEHFYNFQGLRRYKEKFGPEWEPRYLVSPGGLVLPQVLTNLTGLISGQQPRSAAA